MSLAPVDAAAGERVYLRAYLAPLVGMLARPDVTDIYVNRPGELWVETTTGTIERHEAPALDEPTLARLARQFASAHIELFAMATERVALGRKTHDPL